MSTWPFRFVHASDFHLEQPLMGVAEVPDHLRELFLDAPYDGGPTSFRRRVGRRRRVRGALGRHLAAAEHRAAGTAVPGRTVCRLAERGIGVYWAGGTVDPPEAWPAALPLPEKRPRLSARPGRKSVIVQRDGEPLARLVGVGRDEQRPLRPGDFSPDPAGLYTIAVAHGDADAAALQATGVHYWALGGRHDRSTPQSGPQMVHYCGSPQGRRPEESGVHGCTLVQVDEQRQTRTSLIPTDAVRWLERAGRRR